jgi:dTDP-4-dehydrorhamnose 3,5-epimerase
MRVDATAIAGVLILEPTRHGDARGFFSETFRASVLEAHGVTHRWRQDNHARSMTRGVIRGLHFQAPPHAQAKLIRVVRGAILDVVVDIRHGSPTFGAHVAVELSAENWRQLYAPVGMAHGYCTLGDETDVLYKTSEEYAPAVEGGLNWRDPALAIGWPVGGDAATVNARDQAWPDLADLVSPFVYSTG